jgi:hypothetical protein
MTQQEFDKTSWHKGMKCNCEGATYWIRSIVFGERLLGILPADVFTIDEAAEADYGELEWKRCESIELLNS